MEKFNGFVRIISERGYGIHSAVYVDGKHNIHTRQFTGSEFAGKDVADCKHIITHRERGYNALYKAIRRFTLNKD
jgi:hypothetical protein